MNHVRVAIFVAFHTLAAGCIAKDQVKEDDLHAVASRLTNGGFEAGDLSDWTVEVFQNGGIATFPPTSFADLGLLPPASQVDSTQAVGSPQGAPLSRSPYGLTGSASLRYPFEGSWAAVVNQGSANQNANRLGRSFVVAAEDVEPADGKIHVRLILAPVLQASPGHLPHEQPYVFVSVTNVTKQLPLYHRLYLADEAGVPWKPHGNVRYTDWQLIDVAAGSADLAIGDEVKVEIVAAGCSHSDHWAQVYVDGAGSSVPALTVAAVAPESVNRGDELTYVHRIANLSSVPLENVSLHAIRPQGTSFSASDVFPPGVNCGWTSSGTQGTMTCSVASLNAHTTVDVPMTMRVANSAVGSLIHGNYSVGATGFPSLLGPAVQTEITSGVPYADLEVRVTSVAAAGWGEDITYTIEVENHGPHGVVGATVSGALPQEIDDASWTCDASRGACASASGTGSIATTVDLPAHSKATFVLNASIQAGSGQGTALYSVSASPPAGVEDNSPSNNTSLRAVSLGTTYELTVTKDGVIGGRVTSGPVGIDCGAGCASDSSTFLVGSTVKLTAMAPLGTIFTGWSGGACTGTTNPCAFVMNSDTTIEAHFSYAVQLSAPSNGSFICDALSVAPGSDLKCIATPAPGHGLDYVWHDSVDVTERLTIEEDGYAYVIQDVQSSPRLSARFASSPMVTVVPGAANPRGSVTTDPGGFNCNVWSCGRGYPVGTEVKLTATAPPGIVHTDWTGICAGKPNPCEFIHTKRVTVQPIFEYEIVTNSSGGGSISCEPSVGLGGVATCTLHPDLGHALVALTDNGSDVLDAVIGDVYTITHAQGPHSIEASFSPGVSVTKFEPIDGTVTSQPAAIVCGAGCARHASTFTEGSLVELTAATGPGVAFVGWSGDACNASANPCVFHANQPMAIQAHFGYEILASVPAGNGSIVCDGAVVPGSSATCTITPAPGHGLVSLLDNGSEVIGQVAAGQYLLLDVQEPHTLTAAFGSMRTLTVTKHQAIDGTVSFSPGSVSCGAGCALQSEHFALGTVVSLAATEGPGVVFKEWTGACEGQENPCDVTVDAAKTVGAVFAYEVNVQVTTGGTFTCDSPVEPGDDSDCSFLANGGYILTGLNDNGLDVFEDVFGSPTTGTYTIANTQEPHNLQATFTHLRVVTVSKDEGIDGIVMSTPAGISCGAGCGLQYGEFLDGSRVELTATPGPGVKFMGWSRDVCNGSTEPCIFDANHDVQVRANFAYQFAGRFSGGSLLPIFCSNTVLPGDVGICEMLVPPEFRIVSILDNGVESIDELEKYGSETYRYTVHAVQEPHDIEVVLVNMYAVEVYKEPDIDGMVTSDPQGISCGLGCSNNRARFPENTMIELTATAGPGVVFTRWTGACNSAHPVCWVGASQIQTAHAHFSYLVSGTAFAGGTIACESPIAPGGATFCTVVPDAGYVLVGLTDNGVDVLGAVSGGVYKLRGVEEPHVVEATFSPLRSLTISKVAGIESSVTGTPGRLSCGLGCASQHESFVDGTVVNLTATPSADMVFVGWTGACVGETSPCDVALGADANVGAIFAYPIHVASTAGGQVDCPPHVEPGASAVCTFTPDAGHVLSRATDNGQNVTLVGGDYFIQDANAPHALDVVFKQDRGTTCMTDSECGSGLCVDGFCCDSTCDGQCEACDVAGSEGFCSPVAGAPHGDRDACDSDGSACGGFCDGTVRRSCSYPTTECTPASCADGVATLPASCSGNGSCPAVVQVDCAPFACGAEACLDSCTADADCVGGFFCELGRAACEPNVSISVSGPPAANEGMEIAYTYVVENRAPTASEPLVVTLEIPEGTSFVSLDPQNFDCVGPTAGVITCTHDGLPGASDEPLTLTVEIDEPATVSQIENDGFSVREGSYDAQSGSPLVTEVTTGALYADLRMEVTSDAALAAWDSPSFFTVVVENDGPHDVVGASVQALLPALADSATWTCTSQGGSCRTTAGVDGFDTRVDLPVGGTATFIVRVWTTKGFGPATLTFTAAASAPAGVLDGYRANDTASASVELVEGNVLLLEKDPIGVVHVEPEHLGCGVGCAEASGTFLDGTVVTVTAEAPAGVIFLGWTGACTDDVPSCSFPIGGPVELLANFAFTLTSSTTAGGVIDCPSFVAQGGSATCHLLPAAGFVAHALTDNGAAAVPTGSTYTITDAQGPHHIDVTFLQDRGTSCGDDSVCHTGLCVDGLCCDGACNGPCEACDVAGSEGTCSPVTGAPHGDRGSCGTDGSSCGGSCDGTTTDACTYPGGETSCRVASCKDGIATQPASCAGTGSCPAVVTVSCGPYVCGADTCLTSCGGDFDCSFGNYCLEGACVPQDGLGFECVADNQCASGVCVDGFCCDGACDGQCEACDVEGFEGACTPVLGEPHGDRDACDSDGSACGGFCDGDVARACIYPDASTLCRAPSCADGVAVLPAFCDGAGACPDVVEQGCAPYVCGHDACLGDCETNVDCAEGQYCSAGICVEEKENGGLCTVDDQCGSGLCVDGVCCNAACDGACQACDVTGSEGSCVPVPEDAGCGLYTCGENACLDSCLSDADCVDSAYCKGGTCRPRGDLADWQAVGSGGCSAGGGGGLWLAFFVVGFALVAMRRKTVALGILAICLGAGSAEAQEGLDRSFQANRFQPSGGFHDLLGVSSARVAPHHQFRASFFLNYAHEPLRLVSRTDDSLGETLLHHQTTADFTATIGLFDRIELSAVLPIALTQGANQPAMLPTDLASPPAGGVSDLRLIPKALLYDGTVRLGVALPISLPLATEDSYLGHGSPTVGMRALMEWEQPGALLVSGYVGNSLAGDREFVGLHMGTAFQYGIAAAHPFTLSSARFQAILTATGERVWAKGDEPSPIELTGAVKWFAPLGLDVTVGGGPGLSDGYGTPSYRLLAGVGYTPVSKEERPSAPCTACAPCPAAAPCEPAPMQPSADRDLDLDRDGDGIPDGEDACPDVSGTSNEDPALHGCPRMRATETAIYLPKPIYFAIDSATILGASESALGELATYLRGHEEVRKLSIEGHTDAVGDATANLHLSELRAAAVMEWLIERGVDASRLTSKGYGTSRPVADNATLEGRELNRRVEFKILERL